MRVFKNQSLCEFFQNQNGSQLWISRPPPPVSFRPVTYLRALAIDSHVTVNSRAARAYVRTNCYQPISLSSPPCYSTIWLWELDMSSPPPCYSTFSNKGGGGNSRIWVDMEKKTYLLEFYVDAKIGVFSCRFLKKKCYFPDIFPKQYCFNTKIEKLKKVIPEKTPIMLWNRVGENCHFC